MAIIFIDDEIRGQLANSIRLTRDLYSKPSNILLAHPNGIDYIVLKNRHYYNHQKQVRPSDINEYTKLNVDVVRYTFIRLGFILGAKELNLNGMNLLIDEDFLNPNGKKILKEMISVSENNFEIGDKVVPIGDSIYISLEEAVAWEEANEINQPFLYVVGFSKEKGKKSVNVTAYLNGDGHRSYFEKENLKHYEEPKTGVKELEEVEKETHDDPLECTIEELSILIKTGILQPQDIVLVKRIK
jgi:hypothetical protein